jgi:Ca-activated chloride channel family protein
MSALDDLTLYDQLGLPRDATQEEIRRAYRHLVLHLHPDKNVNRGDTELFFDIQQAFEQLSDPRKKADYDRLLPPEPNLDSPLNIHISYSQPLIARLSESQIIYTLLELSIHPDTDLWVASTPLNISLVVDCSTSMQGKRLDTVKSTAIDLLRKLQPNDIFSLVKFNDFAEILITPGRLEDLKSTEMKIQLLRAGGGTEIFKGLEAGFTQVKQFRSSQRINHIILITDGRTYGDEINCNLLADQSSALGIGISALGIGNEWNDRFLDHITSKTGGICRFIPDNGDIRSSILEEISRLGSSLTEQINFSFQTPKNVKLSSAYRLQPDASPLEPVSPLTLGSMPRQGTMSVLFEIVVKDIPIDETELTFTNGMLNFEIPRHTLKTRYFNRLQFMRPVTVDPVKAIPPTGILNAISLLSLYMMQERAREEMGKGDVNSATRHMEYLATHLLHKGEQDLAQSVLNEVTHMRTNQSFSEEGEKRIKYGTRSLLLPARTEHNKL